MLDAEATTQDTESRLSSFLFLLRGQVNYEYIDLELPCIYTGAGAEAITEDVTGAEATTQGTENYTKLVNPLAGKGCVGVYWSPESFPLKIKSLPVYRTLTSTLWMPTLPYSCSVQ